MEDLSQDIWQFFETYKNCMTLLWRGHVVVIIISQVKFILPYVKVRRQEAAKNHAVIYVNCTK